MRGYSEYHSKKLTSLPFNSSETDKRTIYFSNETVTLHVDQRPEELYVHVQRQKNSKSKRLTSSSSLSSWHLKQRCIIKGQFKLLFRDKLVLEDSEGTEYVIKNTTWSGYKVKQNKNRIAKIKKKFSLNQRKFDIKIPGQETPITIRSRYSDKKVCMYRGDDMVGKIVYDIVEPSTPSSSSCLFGEYFVEVSPEEDLMPILFTAIVFERYRQFSIQSSSSSRGGVSGAIAGGIIAGGDGGGCDGGGC
eukprot:gb/GECH01013111.1/.p1 GENE.gb/GECH01013111.1/~~gb/GECH01013111.1/.p1  ORF type:complete len:247 (+),score=62.17 gb/GECH01013111.1/:1-741(+)